jgi:primosomal protein N' (replication factor Y)
MVFVDMGMARKISVRGIQSPLPVSDSALKRTQAEVSGGRPVLWILDRKGYAGAVICSECGRLMVCPSCGLPVRWDDEENALVCGFCGKKSPLTEVCPFCGAISLQGMKPGLESLRQIGENVLGESCPVYLWHADIRQTVSAKKEIVRGLASGGLVVGSRKAIELCDNLEIGLVCWLDVDLAVNTPFYDARSRAFRMVWESAWRGKGYRSRTIVIQSRVPGSGWQKGLVAGWDHFWKVELGERKELGLPPWRYLVEIRGLKGMKSETRDLLTASGTECLDPDPLGDILWARSGNLARVRKALTPLFYISRSGRGFPRIEVWAD